MFTNSTNTENFNFVVILKNGVAMCTLTGLSTSILKFNAKVGQGTYLATIVAYATLSTTT